MSPFQQMPGPIDDLPDEEYQQKVDIYNKALSKKAERNTGTSGIDLAAITIYDIINAMRINHIRQIQLDTKKSGCEIGRPYSATVTEWYGSVTTIEDCQCNCHCGSVCKQPCDCCSCTDGA